MFEVYQRLDPQHGEVIDDTLVLNYDQREKGRFKAFADSGKEVRVFLERGLTLKIGEVLRSDCGKNIAVAGAEEDVAVACCDDWDNFSRACYHLGNRHVKIQVGERWLRIKPDYVLEDMLKQLGLSVEHERVVFVPEAGAYSQSATQGQSTNHGHHHH